MSKVIQLNTFKDLDEETKKRLEGYAQRELKANEELQYVQYYWGEKLNLTYQEILEFAWMMGRKGVARLRMKELFISEFLHERIDDIITKDLNNL